MDRLAKDYFDACREPVLAEVERIIQHWTSSDQRTYGLMMDYVSRKAKGLRPGLCIAVCRALGGSLEEVAASAAVVELFHNAFLIHDDIEDGSQERRGEPALHQIHGTPIALNVGDGLLALSLRPLLENTERLGLSRTLQILEIVVHMVTESFEGQAIELRWIDDDEWQLDDSDYEEMVRKKTCCYSFVSPAEVGAVVAKADLAIRRQFSNFMYALGLAFQIQDDLLNLADDKIAYGKEQDGDLWEGKRTLMLLHTLRECSPAERERAVEILSLPRPASLTQNPRDEIGKFIAAIHKAGLIDIDTHRNVTHFANNNFPIVRAKSKTTEDIEFLKQLMKQHKGIEYGQKIATQHANEAKQLWEKLTEQLDSSIHTQFISDLTDFVVHREY